MNVSHKNKISVRAAEVLKWRPTQTPEKAENVHTGSRQGHCDHRSQSIDQHPLNGVCSGNPVRQRVHASQRQEREAAERERQLTERPSLFEALFKAIERQGGKIKQSDRRELFPCAISLKYRQRLASRFLLCCSSYRRRKAADATALEPDSQPIILM